MTTESICAKCGGTGFVIVEGVNVSGAKPCDCRGQGRAERLEHLAQIPPLYRNASFDNFNIPGPENPNARRDLTTVLLAVKGFVRAFQHPERPGLLLIGESGTGKTHLAVAAFRLIIENCKVGGLFCNYQTLLNNIVKGYDPTSHSSSREAYRSALDADILLIDDLGAHRTLDWVEDTVNSIITHRCDNAKPLIATTNMPDADAGSSVTKKSEVLPNTIEYKRTLGEAIGPRARSRLFEMCTVVRMPLIEDYRIQRGRKF